MLLASPLVLVFFAACIVCLLSASLNWISRALPCRRVSFSCRACVGCRACVFIKADDSEFATPLIWCSKKLKRIVRSTLFAETYALLEAIDACIFLRRMITSQLLNIENIKIECYVDSQTLCDSIVSNKLNEDKRLRHEIECLKETVELDNVDVYWVSTKLQVANVFTKAGAPTNLIIEVLGTGVLRFDNN